MNKPTLYALITNKDVISKNNGDTINEIRNMATISAAFNVFYNNDPFCIEKTSLGTAGRIGPVGDYDFYYIRNNSEIFKSIQGKKIVMGFPYDQYIFEEASAIFVTTPNWQTHLQLRGEASAEKLKYLYKGLLPRPKCPVVNIGQRTDAILSDKETSPKSLFQFKAQTTGSPVFGYYGNLSADLYPYMGFAAVERLNQEYPELNPMVALAGKFRKGGEICNENIIHIGNVDYGDMPSLLDNSVATFTTESLLCNTLGSQKVLDSIARGVPVLCRRLDTFVSQLGDEYPCFYETENQAYDLSKKLLFDPDFAAEVRIICRNRAVFHQLDNVRERFLAQPELSQLLDSTI